MGSIFGSPKVKTPAATAATPAQQARAAEITQATQEAEADAASTKAADERKARADREAFARGLRGQRSLLSGAGEAGFKLPSTLGGA